jgi:hypothetical protein
MMMHITTRKIASWVLSALTEYTYQDWVFSRSVYQIFSPPTISLWSQVHLAYDLHTANEMSSSQIAVTPGELLLMTVKRSITVCPLYSPRSKSADCQV